jgi:ABC-type branched-subunit amino acid transport system substrate-binding protein
MKKLLAHKTLMFSTVFVAFLSISATIPDFFGLSPEELNGQKIYSSGTSEDDNEILAVMSGVNVPASVMPCINCHGEQGKGKPEGGIFPSNLTWGSLSREYTGVGHNGRSHPAYDEKSLVKAISMGLDPAGNPLHKAMPRYQMSQKSMADLISYLKVIGKQSNQGIEEDEIRLGMLLPTNQNQAEAMHKVLEAFFSGLNKAGGLYGRRISLQGFTPDADNPGPSVLDFVKEKNIFALCGSSLGTDEEEVVAALNYAGVPLIGAISGEDPQSYLKNTQVFYLYAGPLLQAEALFDLAIDSLGIGAGEAAIVYGDTEIDELIQLGRKSGLGKVATWSPDSDPAKNIGKMKTAGTKAIFLIGMGNEDVLVLTQALHNAQWYPYLLVPAEQAGPAFLDAPASVAAHTLIAYPTWPTVISPKMQESFQQFSAANQLKPNYKQSQYAALAAGILLSEALRSSGRDLSRESLRSELEKVQALQTGLVPALSYGINRRTGSMRVFIVSPDGTEGGLKLLQEREK